MCRAFSICSTCIMMPAVLLHSTKPESNSSKALLLTKVPLLKQSPSNYESLMKKVTQEAELKLATAEMDHEQAMVSFREGIKASAIVSLLQARIKMAYEAKETGLVCPAWSVDSWVAKLKELGGKAVPVPAEAGE